MRFATVCAVAATLVSGVFASCDATNAKYVDSENPTYTPSSGQTLTMGSPFEVTWNPTTAGPITVLLLAGPTSNNMSVIATLASGLKNTGSYNWSVPSASSGLGSTLTSGYELKIVDESECTCQDTANFGIQNPNAKTTTITIKYATTSSSVAVVTGASGTGTGTAKVTSPVLQPSKTMSVPASLKSGATTTAGSGASSTSKGFAVPTAGMDWNTGAMMVAGIVGALAL